MSPATATETIRILRRYWFLIPLWIVADYVIGLILFATLLPWLYGILDSLR